MMMPWVLSCMKLLSMEEAPRSALGRKLMPIQASLIVTWLNLTEALLSTSIPRHILGMVTLRQAKKRQPLAVMTVLTPGKILLFRTLMLDSGFMIKSKFWKVTEMSIVRVPVTTITEPAGGSPVPSTILEIFAFVQFSVIVNPQNGSDTCAAAR